MTKRDKEYQTPFAAISRFAHVVFDPFKHKQPETRNKAEQVTRNKNERETRNKAERETRNKNGRETRNKNERETRNKNTCMICEMHPGISVMGVCDSCYRHEEQRIKAQLYRARREGTPATLTLGEWVTTIKHYHNLCAYCQKRPYEVLEHYIPISAGGGTTAENCIPACRQCNTRKGADNPNNQ